MKTPQKWTDAYPQPTPHGDAAHAFLLPLSRNAKWEGRSTSAIAKETNLSKERVEELLMKYYKQGMVFQNAKNEDLWGYWERVPEMMPQDDSSITQKDHLDRLGKAKK